MANKFRNFVHDFLGSPQDPGFLIVGAQKCATSSLHAYLKQHKDLRASKLKEIHYFDRDIYSGKSIEQYREHFIGVKGWIFLRIHTLIFVLPRGGRENSCGIPEHKACGGLAGPGEAGLLRLESLQAAL